MPKKLKRGDKVDWSPLYKDLENRYGKGPFKVLNFESGELEADGHCQMISITKEEDGKTWAWLDYKGDRGEWGEYVPGPPYMCVPPTFSNVFFEKVK